MFHICGANLEVTIDDGVLPSPILQLLVQVVDNDFQQVLVTDDPKAVAVDIDCVSSVYRGAKVLGLGHVRWTISTLCA